MQLQINGPHDKSVGKLLQYWRNIRRKSQLTLALDAEISQRHLSFLESGRAKPSREMVIMLAEALEIPFRERNDLLNAAGFASIYRESAWDETQMTPARKALELILKNQEPFPAVVMDRHWNIIMTNRAAPKFFGLFVDLSNSPVGGNVLRMMFHPKGIRPFVANWETAAKELIQRVFREAVGGFTDPETTGLLDEILAYPDIPKDFRTPKLEAAAFPLIPLEFRKDRYIFNFFSAVTTLGTPQDVTLQELRIESFFPADEKTEQSARERLLT